jgi:hypothetical protein
MHRLQVTGQTAYYIDYDDILDLEVLNGLAAFLGVEARLASLDFRFKKQNPEAIRDKVQNPAEMESGLATVDWFNIQQHSLGAAVYRLGHGPFAVPADEVRARSATAQVAVGLWRNRHRI